MVRPSRRGRTITCKYLFYTYRYHDGSTKTIELPLIHILITSGLEEDFRTVGLVDSGATSSLMPKEIADVLLFEYEDRDIEVTGAGGVFNAKPVTLRKLVLMKDGSSFSSWWNIKVLVPQRKDILPYFILGRDFVFKRFDITFYEKRRKITFSKRK